MRKTALVGLLVMIIMTTASPKASAETLGLIQSDSKQGASLARAAVFAPIEQIETATNETTAKQPEVQIYRVAKNDSLSKIAAAHGTTWKRLFDKNEVVPHPDLITPGDELIIPGPDEILNERPIPETTHLPATEQYGQKTTTATKSYEAKSKAEQTIQARAPSSGNRYTAGYCTWYAKSRRPDLPNNLGNANTWVSRARAQGVPTGSAPRVGAIGQQGMHVVYVESINGEAVTVSEMNFRGRGVISSRTVAASNFQYIY